MNEPKKKRGRKPKNRLTDQTPAIQKKRKCVKRLLDTTTGVKKKSKIQEQQPNVTMHDVSRDATHSHFELPVVHEDAKSAESTTPSIAYGVFNGSDGKQIAVIQPFALRLAECMHHRMMEPDSSKLYAVPLETVAPDVKISGLICSGASTSSACVPYEAPGALITLQDGSSAKVEKMCGRFVVMMSPRDIVKRDIISTHTCSSECGYICVTDIVMTDAECDAIENRMKACGMLNNPANTPGPDDIFVCPYSGKLHDCRSHTCSECVQTESFNTCTLTGRIHCRAFTGADPKQYSDKCKEYGKMSIRAMKRIDDINAQSEATGLRYSEAGTETALSDAPWIKDEADIRKKLRKIPKLSSEDKESVAADVTRTSVFGSNVATTSTSEERSTWERGTHESSVRKVMNVTNPLFDPISITGVRLTELFDSGWITSVRSMFIDHISDRLTSSTDEPDLCLMYLDALQDDEVAKKAVLSELHTVEGIVRLLLVQLPKKKKTKHSQSVDDYMTLYTRMCLRTWIFMKASQRVSRMITLMLIDISMCLKKKTSSPSDTRMVITNPSTSSKTGNIIPTPLPYKLTQCAFGIMYIAKNGCEISANFSDIMLPSEISSEIQKRLTIKNFAENHRMSFVALDPYLVTTLVQETMIVKEAALINQHIDPNLRIDGQLISSGMDVVQDRFHEIATWSMVKLMHDVIVRDVPLTDAIASFDTRSNIMKIDAL